MRRRRALNRTPCAEPRLHCSRSSPRPRARPSCRAAGPTPDLSTTIQPRALAALGPTPNASSRARTATSGMADSTSRCVRLAEARVCAHAWSEGGLRPARLPHVLSSCVPSFRSAWRSQTYVDGWNSQKCTSPPPPSLSIGCSRPALGLCALRADACCHSPCAQVHYHRLWPRVRFQRYAGSLRKRIDLLRAPLSAVSSTAAPS